jgi:hypothetical protein
VGLNAMLAVAGSQGDVADQARRAVTPVMRTLKEKLGTIRTAKSEFRDRSRGALSSQLLRKDNGFAVKISKGAEIINNSAILLS